MRYSPETGLDQPLPCNRPMSEKSLLTVNGGSSSLKFALYTGDRFAERTIRAEVEHAGESGSTMKLSVCDGGTQQLSIEDTGERAAIRALDTAVHSALPGLQVTAVAHRIVHGGLQLNQHQRITPELLDELRDAQPLDPAHLPREIGLVEACQDQFPAAVQIACFDSAFHRDIPRVAQILPVPRRFLEAGVRRLGFHGLSCSWLLEELRRVAGEEAANGRLVIAHLGSGASMTALRNGKPVDTSMAFTPCAGIVMGTRPGDLDPGLLTWMQRSENLNAEDIDAILNRSCGLKGISDTTSDMRKLLELRSTDPRAGEAVDVFCYQARKYLGAYAAALGGLDTLVFSGGIGQRSHQIREQICDGLEFLGLKIDRTRNEASESIISNVDSRVSVRVIAADEEAVMAQIVCDLMYPTP